MVKIVVIIRRLQITSILFHNGSFGSSPEANPLVDTFFAVQSESFLNSYEKKNPSGTKVYLHTVSED